MAPRSPTNKLYPLYGELDIYINEKLFRRFRTGFVKLIYDESIGNWLLGYGYSGYSWKILAEDIDNYTNPKEIFVLGQFYISFIKKNQDVRLLIRETEEDKVALFNFKRTLVDIKAGKTKNLKLNAEGKNGLNKRENEKKEGDKNETKEDEKKNTDLESDKVQDGENEMGEGNDVIIDSESKEEERKKHETQNKNGEEERNLTIQNEVKRQTKIKKIKAKIEKQERLAAKEAKRINKVSLEKNKSDNKEVEVTAKDKDKENYEEEEDKKKIEEGNYEINDTENEEEKGKKHKKQKEVKKDENSEEESNLTISNEVKRSKAKIEKQERLAAKEAKRINKVSLEKKKSKNKKAKVTEKDKDIEMDEEEVYMEKMASLREEMKKLEKKRSKHLKRKTAKEAKNEVDLKVEEEVAPPERKRGRRTVTTDDRKDLKKDADIAAQKIDYMNKIRAARDQIVKNPAATEKQVEDARKLFKNKKARSNAIARAAGLLLMKTAEKK